MSNILQNPLHNCFHPLQQMGLLVKYCLIFLQYILPITGESQLMGKEMCAVCQLYYTHNTYSIYYAKLCCALGGY